MSTYHIDETLVEYGGVDTQIRESLSDALSMSLISKSWPRYGSLYNHADKSENGFSAALDAAARMAGYKVSQKRNKDE